jgi:cyclopropane fatty-acyl-phospholipid synthase-like methyltransferase
MNWVRRLNFNLLYLFNPPWDSGISPPELLDFLQDHKPGRALDLGCGTGTNVITLAQYGWQVTGVDFVRRAIKMAFRKAKAADVQVDLRLGDVTKLEGIRGPFDLALDLGCFHSLDRDGKAAYLNNLQRLLSPGGHWLMYGFFRSDSDQGGSGLDQTDVERMQAHLTLIWRQDGTDRGKRPSAYLLFQKPCKQP